MTQEEQNNLNAERTALSEIIASIPPDDVLDLESFHARLHDVEGRLSEDREPALRFPVSATLTFRGRPVVGSQGVFAEFGMSATKAFADAVVAMAASLSGPLAAVGPVPFREQNQLLITGTATGSFGFELQENPENLKFGEETAIGQALPLTQRLLESTTGSDDDMTDATSGIDPRVISSTRVCLEILANKDAVCGLTVGTRPFKFADMGQVLAALQRLAGENLHEKEASFSGVFQGILPKRRTFEFLLKENETVIVGKVGAAIADPSELNRYLFRPVTIKLTATYVGNGRPRYVLNVLPSWPKGEDR